MFDNRGVAPSSSPPAPYTVEEMADDALGLLDHLQIPIARIAGHSMGGWIAETLVAAYPERVHAAAFLGSCNPPTSLEKAITTVERDTRGGLDYELPPLFYATETMRYLPNQDLQDDATVDTWLMLAGDPEPWPNPGRLGQYEACSNGRPIRSTARLARDRGALPRHGVRARHRFAAGAGGEAAAIIPNAKYVEIADTSHLAPFTDADAVAAALVEFFRAT